MVCVASITHTYREPHGNFDHFLDGEFTNACRAFSRMNRRKADFKFAYKFLEDDL